jgi:long-chain acyl-CoA synthetase
VIPDRPFQDVPALLAALGRLANAEPDRLALTAYRGKVTTGNFTYRELLHRIAAAQNHLSSALGIGRGDRVAVLSPNRLEIPVLYLAAWRLGAALVPLNPGSPPEDWSYAIGHAEAKLLIVDDEVTPRLPPLTIPVCRLEDVATPGVAAGAGEGTGGDLAVVLYTSGTTGQPKGVGLSQKNLLANGWGMAHRFGLDGATQLAVLPLYHAHALGFGLLSALSSGGHLVLAERFDPFAWPDIIRREQVTVTSLVPTLLAPLLETRAHASKVPGLRCVLVSSAPLAVATARNFEERTNIRLVQGWGLSEFTNFACCLSPATAEERRRRLLLEGELTSIGSPLEGTEVKVVGPGGAALGAGERGELCVRGPSRMLGYFKDEAATRATIDSEGWLRSGDEGYFVLDEGQPVFFITGRLKELIIRGGEKVSPLAVERKLFAHVPELEGRLVVLGFPHDTHGEEVGAYIEAPVLDEPVHRGLLAALDTLSLDLRPKVILHGTTPIPRTHTGKIQRRKLQPLFARFATHRGPVHLESV